MFELEDRMSGPASRIQRALVGVNAGLQTTGVRSRRAAGVERAAASSRVASMGLLERESARVSAALNRDLAGQEQAHRRGVTAQRRADRERAAQRSWHQRGPSASTALMWAGGAVGIVGTLGAAVVRLQSQAEDTRVAIGGMFVASDVVGGGDPAARMARGMQLAEGTMARIRRDSAALIGESEDYVSVMQQGLSSILTTGERNMDRITDLSNTFTAVGLTFRLPVDEIGRDLDRMFQGRTQSVTRMFGVLRPQLQAAARAMHLGPIRTAQDLNRLRNSNPTQFNELMRNALGRFGPMLEESSHTWSAQWGGLMSTLRETVLGGTGGAFRTLTTHLGDLNGFLTRNGPTIQAGIGTVVAALPALGSAVWTAIWPLRQIAEAGWVLLQWQVAAADNARSNARLEAQQRGANARAVSVRALASVTEGGLAGPNLDRIYHGLSDENLSTLANEANRLQLSGMGTRYIQGALEVRAAELRATQTVTPSQLTSTLASAASGAITTQTTVHVDATGATDPQAVGEQTAAQTAAAGREHAANIRRMRATAR